MHRKAAGEVARDLGKRHRAVRLQHRAEEGAPCGAQTDGPGGDAVDGGVKVIKAHKELPGVEESCAHDLTHRA